ncbi:MAG: TlpA disulfide reductase family protein [Elusimicrobiota bacterium]
MSTRALRVVAPCLAMALLSLPISCKKTGGKSAVKAAPLILERAQGGGSFDISSLAGKKPILLAFFTTWCPYCKQSMPYLQRFHEKHQGKDIELVGVDANESRDKVVGFIKEHGLTFEVLLAGDNERLSQDFPVRYLPTLYLLGKDMTILKKFEGFHPSALEEIETLIAAQ